LRGWPPPVSRDRSQSGPGVIRGLSGEDIAGFLPGADHKQAIHHAVSGQHAWAGEGTWGKVTPKGIGIWSASGQDRPTDAVLFVSWQDVIEIIAKGCEGGRREAYEAAFGAFMAWARAEHDYPPGGSPKPTDHVVYGKVTDGIRVTTAAIIRNGCVASVTQMALEW
jgi:hypothetical protein